MSKEKQELEKQLLSILEKKETFSKELQSFQKEFKILADNINHHISVVNDLTISENRILKKIHQLDSSNINSEISSSLKNGLFDKIKSIFNPKVKMTEKISPTLEQLASMKYEEIRSEDSSLSNDTVKNNSKNKTQEKTLEKLLTEEIMNEDWPLLEEIEKTRFSLKNKQKTKTKTNSQKEKVTVASKVINKTETNKTNKRTRIKKVNTIEDMDKAIDLATKDNINKSNNEINSPSTEIGNSIINNIEVKDTVQIQTIDEYILEKPTSKKEGLMLWVKFENPEYKEDKLNELHAQYSNFLSSKFENLSSEYIYSIKGPSFKLALRKILSLESDA